MMNRAFSLLRITCVALCAACYVLPAHAATLNVLAQYPTIQAAVTAAKTGDTILVADGTYVGAGNRNIDFGSKDLTVQSASGNRANCVIDCQHTGRAFLLNNGQTAKSNIAGFTIKNGSVSGGNGGGISISSINPTVANCIFTGNSASAGGPFGGGGGMYGGTATDCIFTGNSTNGFGGGMSNGMGIGCKAVNCQFDNNSANVGGGVAGGTVINCTFTNNTVFYGYGGGMEGSIIGGTATNCTFIGNSAGNGGGMDGGVATHCTFTKNTANSGGGMSDGGRAAHCVFTGNSANTGGAMFACDATNCVLNSNSASISGGGMYTGSATNCIFFRNAATHSISNGTTQLGNGGGIYGTYLYFCTFAGNSAQGVGGGVYLNSSPMTNCIVWGNSATGSGANIGGSGTVAYSDIQGGFNGDGNININPLFANLTAGNLHLTVNSPCIDAGTTTIPSYVTVFPANDLDGGKRIVGKAPDMGAYEYGNVGAFGTLKFESIFPAADAQNVILQFRPVGGGDPVNQTYLTTADGEFYLYGIPDGDYNLWVKSPMYLAALVPVTVTTGKARVTVTLLAADSNDDNSCDSNDFTALIGAYNSDIAIPGSGYDPHADFNGDGSVDSSDFTLLIGNFNQVGAP